MPGERFHNLPARATRLLGREDDVAAVRRLLLEGDLRLLTLTGTGGCGKTHLALETARGLAHSFSDGVWLVELASVPDPALVPHAVASVFGLREHPRQPLITTLAGFLQPKALLLVLDNCEHVVDACASLVDALLSACPTLRILATSREPLQVHGETTHRVSPLDVPDPEHLPQLDELAHFPGVALFVERAQAVQPSFALTPQNVQAVVGICVRLDGIPLALELAAARVRVLAVEQILARLDDTFALLTASSRTAPSRQRTLKATLDWSYALLSAPERTLFARLAVFAGGFGLDAAEAVCAGEGLEQLDVLELLTRVVDRSLITVLERDREVRYRLLEPVREYARQLLDSGTGGAVRRRHAEHFLALAEAAQYELTGPELPARLERLTRERDNLRTALGWFMERQEADPALRMAGSLAHFWLLLGHLTEARSNLEMALQLPAARPPVLPRARALLALGQHVLSRLGDFASARTVVEESLAVARAVGDGLSVAAALRELGRQAVHRGDFAAARVPLLEALGACQELGDLAGTAWSLHYLGELACFQSDASVADSYLGKSLVLFRELGDRWGICASLFLLGRVACDQGDYARARSRLGEVVDAIGVRVQELPWGASYILQEFAHLAAAQGQARRALRLAGAAATVREALGSPLASSWVEDAERRLAPARQALGEAAATGSWADGCTLSLEQALAEALAPEPSPPVAGRPVTAARQVDALTPREVDVARLLALEYSNRQIAEALVIAEGTARSHVEHVREKLGLRSRHQIADWARAHGLVVPNQD